jgi:hypothetical protein
MFRSFAWNYSACDGFDTITARAATIAALMPIALGLLGRNASTRMRIATTLSGAILLGATLILVAPQCLSPYGGVDTALRILWLNRVAEAQSLLEAPPATALGYAGLTAAGLAASGWFVWKTRSRGWLMLLALQLAAATIMVAQLRGAYAGALLAAPALGALIVAARRANALALTTAWAASAGIFYPFAAQAMVQPEAGTGGASCTAPDLIAALGRLPSGTVMAPIDTGAPAIAETDHRLIAGAYHRDGAGNLAMYSFYRGTPETAHGIAQGLSVRWVVACDGFAGVSAPFARQLERAAPPNWLRRVAKVSSGGQIFEVTNER